MPAVRLILATLALVFAGPAALPDTPARPALWVARDGDTAIYLFGTVHELRPRIGWFDGAVARAFSESDTLILELVAPPDAEVQAELARAAPPASVPDLPSRLPPGYAAKLRAALVAVGYAPDAFDRVDPWVAATTLSILPLRKAGFDRANGGEAVLSGRARATGKPVEGLETQASQIAMFDRLPDAAQIAMLIRVLDGGDGAVASMEQTQAAWIAGDVPRLAAIVAEDMAKSPAETGRMLLSSRHAAWGDWIARRMESPGTVFVAVGTGHLVGHDALQRTLAARGIAVRRVQ